MGHRMSQDVNFEGKLIETELLNEQVCCEELFFVQAKAVFAEETAWDTDNIAGVVVDNKDYEK